MESSTVHRAYRFRLEPTADQEQSFRQFAGARRWVWNWALEQRRQYYKETGKTLPAGLLSARLTALKDQPETAWLREMDSQLLQQALADLDKAFANFFARRARYPRFKSKKTDVPRFRIPQRVTVVDGRVRVPKVGRVRARLSQPVVGTAKSATFKQDACGHWHVTLVAEHEGPVVALPAPDPERAALIANTVTQEFTDYYSQINRTEATSTRKFIEDQLSRTKEALARGENEMLAFKFRTGAVGLSDQISRMVGRALDMQASFDTAALEERTSRAKMEAIQSRLRGQNDQFAQLSMATNPIFAKLRDNLTALEVDLASLRQTYTDQHPKVQQQLGKIAAAKRQMSEEASKVAGNQSLGVSPVREQMIRDLINTQVDAEAARARTAGMSQLLAKMQASLSSLPANELQLARLQRDVKVHEDTYLRLSALYEDALIRERKAGSSGQAAVIVVDPATVPYAPVSNRLPLMATFAALLGLVVGSAVALLVDGLDDRVRSANEIEGAYGVPVLAAIPTMDPKSHRYLSGASAISTVSVPVVIAVLLGVAAAALSLFLVHQGVGSDRTALFSRIFEVFQSVR